MTKELWVSLLTFIAGVLALATQLLPVQPDLIPWLTFAIAVINLGLGVFFGVAAYRAFRARSAAKAATPKGVK